MFVFVPVSFHIVYFGGREVFTFTSYSVHKMHTSPVHTCVHTLYAMYTPTYVYIYIYI